MIPSLPIPSDSPTAPLIAAVILAIILIWPIVKSLLRAAIIVLGVMAVVLVAEHAFDIPLLGVF